MCLAMVYTDKVEPENLVLSNVQRIECKDGMVYLTDLLDRQVVVEGEIVSVDLVGNTTIIRKTQKYPEREPHGSRMLSPGSPRHPGGRMNLHAKL